MELRAAAQVADAVLAGPSPGDAAVLLVDGDLHVTHCAGPVQDAYGCEPGELVGRPLAALLRSSGARLAARGVRAALERGATTTCTVRTQAFPAAPLELHVAPLLGAGGQPTAAIVVARDPSPAAVAAPPQADLPRFAAIIAHELSEPLLLVRGYADLLRLDAADRLTQDERRQLDVIWRTATRMQGLVDGLLRHAESGRSTVGVEMVDMERVVGDVLAMLETRVAATQAVVRCGPLAPVPGDARLLFVLVRNLLSNALKFSIERPLVIEISCEAVPGGWRLEVADNGIGIPEHELPRIFGMFERVDRSRYPGFGIGLASVRRIAELHGGGATVSSQVGVGSRFAVLLTDRRA
jgi:signal transduction histidine kinase